MAGRRTREAAIVCALLAFAAAGVAISVVVGHRTERSAPRPTYPAPRPPDWTEALTLTGRNQLDSDGAAGSYTVHLLNSGTAAITVLPPQQGALPPGMQVVAIGRDLVVAAGRSVPLTLSFRITDCHLIPKAQWPLRLRAYAASSAQAPKWVQLTPSGPDNEPWQTYVTRPYCGSGP